MTRRLKRSWLESYLHWIADATESPTRFHFWSAASVIGASLKRGVWVERKTFKIYPNMYTVLVGRPGVGKGAAIKPALSLLKEAGTANMLSDRITMEYVLEKLSKGFPSTSVNPLTNNLKIGMDASVLIVSDELSVFITASQFSITALTNLWDAGDGVYGYGTRGKGEFNITSPCVSLLGGSAPEWLCKSIPSDAVGGGFTRRVNFVLANKKDKKIAWPSMNGLKTRTDLIEDLREISQLKGEYTIAQNARQSFEDIYNACEPNEFDDEATAGYKISRWANALKLAMVISASRGDDLLISREDWATAVQKTEEVTNDMGIVFRAVGEATLTSAIDKVMRFIELKGYAKRQEVLKANWRHVTSEDLDRIIVTMREAGILGERVVGGQIEYFDARKVVPINP